MHGNEKVIEQLNAALASELTAIVQYMVQSETCQNWGYVRIGGYLKRRAIEEMGHAEGLIERIVFLDAAPKVDVALTPKIGANVQQQLEGDLKDEEDAVRQYNSAINVCAKAGDNGSGDLFQTMLKDEEGHADCRCGTCKREVPYESSNVCGIAGRVSTVPGSSVSPDASPHNTGFGEASVTSGRHCNTRCAGECWEDPRGVFRGFALLGREWFRSESRRRD